MKRDFREEYTNYIESDMPDLWSRIEPNLKEKTATGPVEHIITAESATTAETIAVEEHAATVENITDIKNKKNRRAKIYRFIKVATPVAAGLCILVIGVGVLNISNKSEEATMDSAAAMEEACTTEETVEEEPMMEEAAAEEAPQEYEESYEWDEDAAEDYAVMEDYAASEETDMTNDVMTDALQNSVQTESASEESMRENEMSEAEVEIAGALLLRIAKTSESEQEAGFAYIYVFRLEDGEDMKVYVTDELCDELEEKGGKLQRQKNYRLTLHIVSDTMKQEGDFSADYILQNAEELP